MSDKTRKQLLKGVERGLGKKRVERVKRCSKEGKGRESLGF